MAGLGLAGCGGGGFDGAGDPEGLSPKAEVTGRASFAESWDGPNTPWNREAPVETLVDRLPVEGTAAVAPVPGDYWPTTRDSLNARWDGPDSASPAEKYEQAFHREGLPDIVSRLYGIDRYADQPACIGNADCLGGPEMTVCAKRRGHREGRCIPTWWGICHGWAAYSISEPGPLHSVVHNGVTFEPGDLEGLMSLLYSEGIESQYLGARCNSRSPEANSGRLTDPACRDVNPGTLHVALANRLGLEKKSMVIDLNADLQVWNHPVRSFEVTNAIRRSGVPSALQEISRAEASALVDASATEYGWSSQAARFFHVRLLLHFVQGAPPGKVGNASRANLFVNSKSYEYVLETDAQGAILGGEWVKASRESHPDFIWWPSGSPPESVAEGLIRYDEVKLLNDAATRGEVVALRAPLTLLPRVGRGR